MADIEVIKERAAVEIDFDDLVLENHQLVRLFLARFVHCPQRVDDLAQETFVTAFKQQHRFEGRSKPSTWLIGIARNKALQFLRLEQRQKNKIRNLVNSMPGFRQLQESQSDFLEDESVERIEALKNCLSQLPSHSFELIEQFYFGGVTAVAIAAASNAKESSIRMKLKRIRHVLQKCIRLRLGNNTPDGLRSS